LDRNGKKLLGRAFAQGEAELLSIIASLARNRTLLLVDQPATIGALPVAVAQTNASRPLICTGLAMRRLRLNCG
jgi:hypothetical protein